MTFPQAIKDGQQFVADNNLHPDKVTSLPLDSLGVEGTPTLLLVNKSGVVINEWIGKLPPQSEKQVLETLQKEGA